MRRPLVIISLLSNPLDRTFSDLRTIFPSTDPVSSCGASPGIHPQPTKSFFLRLLGGLVPRHMHVRSLDASVIFPRLPVSGTQDCGTLTQERVLHE